MTTCGTCIHFNHGSGLTRSYCAKTEQYGGYSSDPACEQYQANSACVRGPKTVRMNKKTNTETTHEQNG